MNKPAELEKTSWQANLKIILMVGILLVAMAGGWTLLTAKVEGNEYNIDKMETALQKTERENVQFRETVLVQLARIETELVAIRRELNTKGN